jgi:hypothetical protein
MEQLEYWQAIEDGEAVEDDEPKKKKKRKKTKKDETETKSSEESTVEAKSLKPLRKKNR